MRTGDNLLPDNPVARKSVHRYIAALSKAFADVAKITADWIEELALPCEFQRLVRCVRRSR